MPQFKAGDVGFVMHHANPLSRLMAWFMRSQWSHSFMVLEVANNRTYVIETSDFTVTFGCLEFYEADTTATLVVYRDDSMTDDERLAMANSLIPFYNQLYGYLQLFSMAIRTLLARIGIKIPNFITQGLLCDQLVLEGLVKYSPAFKGIAPKSLETEEMYEKVIAANFTKIL